MFEGLFDSETAKEFIRPLNDIIKVGITEKVLLDITDDGLKICAAISNTSNAVVLNYKKELFKNSKLPASPETFGIKDLGEVVGIMRAFSDGFKITIEDEIMTISSGKSKFTYYGCNEKFCKRGPRKFDISNSVTQFIWNDDMKSFTTAMNQMREQEHIVLMGNKDDTVSNIVVTNKQFKISDNFLCKVDCSTILDNYRIILSKNRFQPVISGSIKEFIVNVLSKAVVLYGDTEYFTIMHAVSPMKK